MGRIRNVMHRITEDLERDKAIKGRELTHVIICMAFEDDHIHALYPEDKFKTTQMLQMMVDDKKFHFGIKK